MSAPEFILLALAASATVAPASAQFGSNDYYYDNWCGWEAGLTYLDDKDCQKVFPSSMFRDWTCPAAHSVGDLTGYAVDGPLSSVAQNKSGLSAFAAAQDVNMQLIMIRRTPDDVYYSYLSSGDLNEETWETWSHSKIFAAANAEGRLREDCDDEGGCYACGLDSATTGKNGRTPLGDLATVVCSYDETAGYESNSVAAYFHDVGGRDRIHDLVNGDWLGTGLGDSLGGDYGLDPPFDLGFDFENPDGDVCSVNRNVAGFYENSLSALAAAEMTRRVVLHRDVDTERRFPDNQWAGMQSLLYGAGDDSELFPGVQWGGMTADTAIYVQAAVPDMEEIEERSQGQWRIFSKLGAGYSSSRSRGEITYVAYACMPVVNDDSEYVLDAGGVEFVLSARGSVPGDVSLRSAEDLVHAAVDEVVGAVLDGRIQ